MSAVTLPVPFAPNSCALKLSVNQRVNASPFGGSEQAVDLLNDRWLMSLDLPPSYQSQGAGLEAFINAMRGQSNWVALYHFVRQVPRGTMRGSLTMSSAAAQGASSLVVTGGAGQASTTLLAGDLIGVSGLLFMVASDCVANGSGVITAPIVNRLRVALGSGLTVTWNRPTALFRLISTPVVEYAPGLASGVSFELAEYIP